MALEEVKNWFKARQLEVGIALVGLILVGVGVFWWKTGGNESDRVEILSASSEATASSQAKIVVDVEGAVGKSGVYEMDPGARIDEALQAAGGITTDADTKWIEMNLNRAGKLTDGMKIYIPSKNDQIPMTKTQTSSNNQISKVININTASQGELESLPGIGPVTAGKIIGGRLYGNTSELLSRKIVGQKVFDQIKDLISL